MPDDLTEMEERVMATFKASVEIDPSIEHLHKPIPLGTCFHCGLPKYKTNCEHCGSSELKKETIKNTSNRGTNSTGPR